MNKRKAIGKVVVGIIIFFGGLLVGTFLTPSNYLEDKGEVLRERQLYAQNAYNLGKAEYLALTVMSQNESHEIQNQIQQIMNQELSLDEQEKKIEEIFQKIQDYIADEKEEPLISGL